MRYKIERKFLDGILKGLTITDTTKCKYEVGKTYTSALTNVKYKVLSVKICLEKKGA